MNGIGARTRLAALLLAALCALPCVAAAPEPGAAAPPTRVPAASALDRELVLAALRDDGPRVMVMMLRGADPNARDERGQPALHLAIKGESEHAVEMLLQHPGLDLNAANAAGETPLMLAALKGRLGWAQALVTRGARIKREGWSPLHYACSGPDGGVVAWLLRQGAQIEARSPNGTTPLMMASGYGGLSTAEALLKAGADPRPRNDAGLSAADFAERAGHANFARTLRDAAGR